MSQLMDNLNWSLLKETIWAYTAQILQFVDLHKSASTRNKQNKIYHRMIDKPYM